MIDDCRRTGLLLAAALCLVACGGGSGGSSTTSTTVSGTAASGAPLASATVSLRCQNSWTGLATTNTSGQWSLVVPTTNLPCAVQATSSDVSVSYYAFTMGSSSRIVTNVTPLTSLALVRAAGVNLDTAWFAGLNDADRQTLASGLTAAIAALNTALAAYDVPSEFNPFTLAFVAQLGNNYDDLLEQLHAALLAADQSFDDLLEAFATGGEGSALPAPVPASPGTNCTVATGDGKLVFSQSPADFCGFVTGISANTIDNYYQFTSTAGEHGTTYVKVTVSGDGTSDVQSVVIENDAYHFACGTPFSACLGVTQKISGNLRQFYLKDTVLTAVSGSTQDMTVNGHLMYQPATTGGGSSTIATPTLSASEYGVRFATNGTVQGASESGVERFWDGHGDFSISANGRVESSYLNLYEPAFHSFALEAQGLDTAQLPTATGTYDCGQDLKAADQLNISLAYAAGQGYSSVGTRGVSGFSCSVIITHVGSVSGNSYIGYLEGNFKARLFKTGATVNLANSIVVSGSFRLGD